MGCFIAIHPTRADGYTKQDYRNSFSKNLGEYKTGTKLIRRRNSFVRSLCCWQCSQWLCILLCANNDLKDNTGFGTWYNTYKDSSYTHCREIFEKDSVLMLGSSEFRHGRKTCSTIQRTSFKDTDVKPVTVGGPFNQTLFHTVALGSLNTSKE